MIPVALWLYGLIVGASLFMLLSWGDAARQLAGEFGGPAIALRWCKAFVIAAGLTIHASFMAAACGYRAFDIVVHGTAPMGSDASYQIAMLIGLGLSKVAFVWAGSIQEQPRHIRWPWWGFVYAMLLWAVACWAWATIPTA